MKIEITEEFNNEEMLAEAIEYIAKQIRDGFTSGYNPTWRIIKDNE